MPVCSSLGVSWAVCSILFVPLLYCSVAAANERKLTATVGLKQEYSDNLFFDAEHKETDFITTVSPGLELIDNTERMKLGLNLRWDASSYWDHDSLNDVDHDYAGSFRYALTERANVFSSAKYRRDSRSDRDLTDTGLILDAVRREQYRFSLGGGYSLSEVFGMQVQYSFAQDDYENNRYTDNTSHDITTTFSRDLSEYWANTVGRVNLGVTFYDSDSSTVDNYSATVGLEKKLSELFSYFLDVGLRFTDSQYDSYRLQATTNPLIYVVVPYEAQEEGIGFMGRSGVSYRDELNDGTLSASHDIQPASGSSGTVERTSLQLQIGRRIAETSRAYISTGYTINKSTDDIANVSATDENSWWLSPGISYDFTRELRVIGSYSYAYVQDNAADEDKERNLFMVRLEYKYPIME